MSTQTAPNVLLRQAAADRPRQAPRDLWQVPTFFTGLAAVALMIGAAALGRPAVGDPLTQEIAELREALRNPRTAPEGLVPLAEVILTRVGSQSPRTPEAHFLAGLVYARLADHLARGNAPERAKDERKKAFAHLELAEARGLASADQPRLQYYLGKLLYLSGGDLPRVIDHLNRTAAQGADDPAEAYGILANAYLRLPTPDLDAALKANQKQLEHTESEAAAGAAWLLRAELLLRKGLRPEALKVLRHVGAGSPREVALKARYLQARTAQEEGLWAHAVPLWKELLTDPTAVPGGKGQILYSLGLCHAATEPREDAAADAAWREAVRLGGPAGQAAALRLGELRLRGKEPATALGWFRTALEKVQTAKDYQNRVLGLDRARALCEAGCRTYREGQDHEHAAQLAELYRRIALPGVAEECLAQATEAHAAALLARPRPDVGPAAASLEDQARVLYRRAAAAYKQAAAGRTPAEKAARLRCGADCAARARDHVEAIALWQQFVELEPAPERKVEGWFALAAAHRAARQADLAVKAYEQCIQFPRSPLAFRARLELAELAIEQGDLKQAEAVLKQVLELAGPASDRQAEEQGLYRLADLLFQQKRFDDAAFRLEQALGKYPDNPDALTGRDRLGECYRQRAEQAKQENAQENLPGTKRLFYRSAHQENLEKARVIYQKLADDLEQRAAARTAPATEKALLAKALLTAADCIYEQPNGLPEALRRYKTLAGRFRGRVEGLMVCLKLLNCCRTAAETPLARDAVEAAQQAVKGALEDVRDPRRMPDSAFNTGGNRATRAQWENWLVQISEQLASYPAAPLPRAQNR